MGQSSTVSIRQAAITEIGRHRLKSHLFSDSGRWCQSSKPHPHPHPPSPPTPLKETEEEEEACMRAYFVCMCVRMCACARGCIILGLQLTCDNLICKECLGHETLRTADGTCNNLQRPLWGSAFQPFKRYLRPRYEDGR